MIYRPDKETDRLARRLGLWFVASCMALILACAAFAQTPDPTRKAIQALYDKEARAMSKGDTSVYVADLSPNFVSIMKSGKIKGHYIDVKRAMTVTASLMKMLKHFDQKTVIQKYQRKDSTAVVTIQRHTETVMANPQQGGKEMSIKTDEVLDETWTKSGKAWLRTHSKEVSSTGDTSLQ